MAALNMIGHEQLRTLAVLERVGGSMSLVSVALVFVSYACFRQVRTTPNGFIMLASVANAGASIAHIMADAGSPQAASSARCQARGFLLEWFALSQPLWSLAMAINVLSVLGRAPNAIDMPRWGWIVHSSICFGGPLLVAVAFLLLRHYSFGPVSEHEEGWCWTSARLVTLRISVPAWGCVLASLIIYTGIALHNYRLSKRTRPIWEGKSPRSSVSSQASVAKPRSDDVLSLSDWPLSAISGVMFFGRDDDRERAADASSPSLPRPAPAHTPPSPASSWLGTFALSPRPAPTPPPRRRVSVAEVIARCSVVDEGQRACLQTGLSYALTLLVTWLPGTVQVMRRLTADTDPSYGFLAATAAVFPLQGIWIAAVFSVMNWRVMLSRVEETRRPRSGIRELLGEPGDSLKRASVDSKASEKKDPLAKLPWRPKTLKRHPSWDFLDIGLEPRENERVYGRMNE
ncbi:hypothetical protein VTK26DRAFT_3395 [Humicola hyalothermophila]